jgi:hypothetical protein
MENFHNHSSTGTGDWKLEHVIFTSYISWLSHGWWKKWNFTWNDNNTLTVKYITIKSFEIQTFRYFFPLIKGQGYQYSMSVLGQDVLNMWTTFLVNIFALTHHWTGTLFSDQISAVPLLAGVYREQKWCCFLVKIKFNMQMILKKIYLLVNK